MERNEFVNIVKESKSKSDVCKLMSVAVNGRGYKRVNELISKYKVDISHFDGGKSKNTKYKLIDKECPVCGDVFETRNGHPKEKETCSYSCSNTYFRSGVNNPNWNDDTYRTTCFHYHNKECIVCGEDKIVDVHHYDENNKNNDPSNLVPLCPTHHMYLHSRHKHLILSIVDDYVKDFIECQGQGGPPRLGRGH